MSKKSKKNKPTPYTRYLQQQIENNKRVHLIVMEDGSRYLSDDITLRTLKPNPISCMFGGMDLGTMENIEAGVYQINELSYLRVRGATASAYLLTAKELLDLERPVLPLTKSHVAVQHWMGTRRLFLVDLPGIGERLVPVDEKTLLAVESKILPSYLRYELMSSRAIRIQHVIEYGSPPRVERTFIAAIAPATDLLGVANVGSLQALRYPVATYDEIRDGMLAAQRRSESDGEAVQEQETSSASA